MESRALGYDQDPKPLETLVLSSSKWGSHMLSLSCRFGDGSLCGWQRPTMEHTERVEVTK